MCAGRKADHLPVEGREVVGRSALAQTTSDKVLPRAVCSPAAAGAERSRRGRAARAVCRGKQITAFGKRTSTRERSS